MSDTHSHLADTMIEATKAAPPVVVTSVHFLFDVPLNHWVLIATLIYTVLQIFLTLEKRFKRSKDNE